MSMAADQPVTFAPPGEGEALADASRAAPLDPAERDAAFAAIYTEHLGLVWRSLRALGVAEGSIEDATQDVFIVVHRRLADFEARSSSRTWLYGIVLRIARNYRRREHRKGGLASLDVAHELPDAAPGPHEEAATAEELRRLTELLNALDEDKREVFVLFELEQMSAPEIAEMLGVNVNTVSSRLRAARRALDAAVEREDGGRR
jgi:RNA polymerase sigma-70 factor, ECF subfamily